MNEAAVNVEFYYDVELEFLGEWLVKPKYDGDESGYGKSLSYHNYNIRRNTKNEGNHRSC
jgi:hypothetical protein